MKPDTTTQKLPEPPQHLLLPKAHVHFFGQIVLFVIGLIALVGGAVLYFIGLNGTEIIDNVLDAPSEINQLFFFLGVGGLMGVGIACLLVWALWKFVIRYRIRFAIAIAVSTIAIVSGLISIAGKNDAQPAEYTFYFFSLTIGLLVGLSALGFFFLGVARHLFGTHKYLPPKL